MAWVVVGVERLIVVMGVEGEHLFVVEVVGGERLFEVKAEEEGRLTVEMVEAEAGNCLSREVVAQVDSKQGAKEAGSNLVLPASWAVMVVEEVRCVGEWRELGCVTEEGLELVEEEAQKLCLELVVHSSSSVP